ncbi:hypothetical protein T459_10329 [Capsicum annuum]|uniref:Uncharacterized protein n=1 Tax=Capsicum annuum TaxID=4072 RepID=A0A2G3A1V8_CAPAN|nr:hypothetical protein T459_10329 [Capsicum annuum]
MQIGDIEEYQEKLDRAMARVSLSNENAISCFITGLRPKIRDQVNTHRPYSLPHTYHLARLLNSSYIAQQKSSKSFQQPNHSFSSRTPNTYFKPALKPSTYQKPFSPSNQLAKNKGKRLTTIELNDKRLKELCYFFYEKLFPGHKYISTK